MSPQAPTAARLGSPETPHIEGLKSLAGDEKKTFVHRAAKVRFELNLYQCCNRSEGPLSRRDDNRLSDLGLLPDPFFKLISEIAYQGLHRP